MKIFSRLRLRAFTPLKNLNINGEKEPRAVILSLSYGLNGVSLPRRKCRGETTSFLTGPVRNQYHSQMKVSNRAGFTLIELVIAIAVLAILVTMAIAAMQNITQKAQIARLKATLKSVRSEIVIQKTNNQLENSITDSRIGANHPRVNFWPTFEEVRAGSFDDALSLSILDSALPDNPFINPAPRTPPFDNDFSLNTGTSICYPNDVGSNNANNLVVCVDDAVTYPKGTLCPAADCQAAYVYNPVTGDFWANSNQFGENNW